jgi:hypothetical protein
MPAIDTLISTAGYLRRGRAVPLDDLPHREGMRRPHAVSGHAKELNENLSPLRRCLERQLGRPWNKVYSEIAAHLRADNTVQQHVPDHLRNFVAIHRRRRHGWYFVYPGDRKEPFSHLVPAALRRREGRHLKAHRSSA